MNPSRRSISVRTRITFWNVGVMALVLAVLGVLLRYTVHAYLIASIDREMNGTYVRFSDRWQREDGWERARRERERAGGDSRPRDERPRPNVSPGASRPGASPLPSPPPPEDSQRPRFLFLGEDGKPIWGRDSETVTGPIDPVGFRAALKGVTYYSTLTLDGEPVRVVSGPLRRLNGTIQGVFQTHFNLADIDRGLGAVTLILVILLPLALLAAGVGGAFLTERALRPVREVTEAASHIEADDLSGRLPVSGDDEFAALSRTFNGMLERLESAFNRQRRFTADASHELRTPLSVIKASTSLALESPRSGEEYRAILETIDPAADRMERIVRDLLFLARSDGKGIPVERQFVLVRHLIEDAAREIDPFGSTPGAEIVIETADPDLVMAGDAHHLHRLLVNLLENADRHTPAAGRITVSAEPDGDGVRLRITDTGEGISPEHLPHVFDQFYRVDAARSRASGGAGGAGLGLAICKAIVEAHAGEIRIESERGRGTTVTVRLPGRVAAPVSSGAV